MAHPIYQTQGLTPLDVVDDNRPLVAFDTATVVVLVGATVNNTMTWSDADSSPGTPVQDISTPAYGGNATVITPTDLTLTSGTATFTMEGPGWGGYTIVATITDFDGFTANGTFLLTVQAPPTIVVADSTSTIQEGGEATMNVVWTDPDATVDKPIASIAVTAGVGSVALTSADDMPAGTAVWTHPAAAPADDGTITLTITDFDGNTANDSFTLTVTPASDPPPKISWNQSQVDITQPIGSPMNIGFSWQDDETSPANPVLLSSFIVKKDGVDITAEGTVSPGNLDSSDPQPGTFSTSAFDVLDDTASLTIQVTDGDSNTTVSAGMSLSLPFIDPLKELVGHPVSRTTEWVNTSGIAWVDDAANGGTTSITAVTGYDGGSLIGPVGSPAILTMTGDTGTSGTVGSHDFNFQIGIPTGSRVSVTLKLDGNEVDRVFVSGPQSPSSTDNFQVTALLPFPVANGEVLTVELYTDRGAFDATVPTAAQQGFWTLTDLGFSAAPASPAPPSFTILNPERTTTEGSPISNTGTFVVGSRGPATLTASIGTITPSGPQTLSGSYTWSLPNALTTNTGTVTLTITDGTDSSSRTFDLQVDALAADYYVSGTGNDGNPGTIGSPKRQYQSAADAGGNDIVIAFERGYEYEVTTGVSFNAGQILIDEKDNVTLVPYGTGNCPIIRGSIGGTVYPASDVGPPTEAGLTTTLGLVEIRNSSNCTIRGFHIIDSNHCGVTVRNAVGGIQSDNNVIEECYIDGARAHGILVVANDHNSAVIPPNITDTTIRYNHIFEVCLGVTEARVGGVRDTDAVGQAGGEGLTYSRATTGECYGNLVEEGYKEGLAVNNSSFINVHHNRAGMRNSASPYTFGQGGGCVLDGAAVGNQDCNCYANEITGDGTGIVISSESGGENRRVRVFNNISRDNNTIQFGMIGNAGNPAVSGASIDCEIYNNLFVGNSNAQNVSKIIETTAKLSGFKYKANIHYRPSGITDGPYSFTMLHNDNGNNASGWTGLEIDYNGFWSNGTATPSQYDGDHAVTADPMLESNAFVSGTWQDANGTAPTEQCGTLPTISSSYYLSESSPYVRAIPVGYVTEDMIGVARINPDDIGPFVREGSIAPPLDSGFDILKELTGHPDPETTQWSTPTNLTWKNDQDNGGTTWVTETSTGFIGGVSPAAEASKSVSTFTAGALDGGQYTIYLRAHLQDIDMSLRVRLLLDGVVVDDSSHTGPHLLADFASGQDFNIQTRSVGVAAGETLTFEMFTERYDSTAGSIETSPTDFERPFVTLMEMFRDPVLGAPTGNGTLLFDWESDDDTGRQTGPTKAAYDTAVGLLPVDGPTGRPEGDNSHMSLGGGVGRFEFPINWEVPRMNTSEDSLEMFRETPNHDGHCMLRARMTNGTYIESSSYMKAGNGEEYEVELKVDITGRTDGIGEGRNVMWGIIWQAHPGSFPVTPNDWAGNPPLALQIDDGSPGHIWKLHVRGHTTADPQNFTNYNSTLSYEVDRFWAGVHTFIIQYKPNYTGVGTYLKLWHNGEKMVDVVDIPIGLNFSALGGVGNQSLQTTFGAYGWGNVNSTDLANGRPDMDYRKFSIRAI